MKLNKLVERFNKAKLQIVKDRTFILIRKHLQEQINYLLIGYKDKDDYNQEINVQILKALERFEPERGFQFVTFVDDYLRNGIRYANLFKEHNYNGGLNKKITDKRPEAVEATQEGDLETEDFLDSLPDLEQKFLNYRLEGFTRDECRIKLGLTTRQNRDLEKRIQERYRKEND